MRAYTCIGGSNPPPPVSRARRRRAFAFQPLCGRVIFGHCAPSHSSETTEFFSHGIHGATRKRHADKTEIRFGFIRVSPRLSVNSMAGFVVVFCVRGLFRHTQPFFESFS